MIHTQNSMVQKKLINRPFRSVPKKQPSDTIQIRNDAFGYLSGGSRKGLLFVIINQLHDTIKFPDSQFSDTIDFLDFTITINSTSRQLEFELFIKPSNVGIFLSFESAHPKSVLLSVAENELRRAVKRSNTDLGKCRSLDKISKLLLKNGYPTKIIDRCMKKVQRPAEGRPRVDYIGDKNVLKLQ